ncbi:alkaline ceramidase 1 [Sapajus apella]|uniref:Alkaline ceramidase n=1 Tax=Sapajus apella TaxID=9515 RepID=A0A6J3FQC2_SAPAP|nr:alkaline ceramidase 1 [Sapajus apella]
MPPTFLFQPLDPDVEGRIWHQFTNVPFFIFGPLMMFLMHPYAQRRSRYIYIVWVLFMVIGLFSMYFHMTLSFLGQLLDEIAILWFLGSAYGIWMPRCYFPSFLGGNRSQFICLVFITTAVSTFLSFLRPTVNAYALNSIGLHVLYIVCQEYRKTSNKELRHLIEVCVVLWAGALTSWISDRLHCSFWQRIHFFYLHSIWHVLISITFPYGMVTMALVDASYEMPGETLKVRYWPRDRWPVGLPYVEIQGDDKNC